MTFLSKIRQKMNRKAIGGDPVLSASADGFTHGATQILWQDIAEIYAHKVDLLTTDEVRFVLTLTSGRTLTISEEQQGFTEVVASLAREFPSVVGWERKIIQPAFAHNHTVLYRRT